MDGFGVRSRVAREHGVIEVHLLTYCDTQQQDRTGFVHIVLSFCKSVVIPIFFSECQAGHVECFPAWQVSSARPIGCEPLASAMATRAGLVFVAFAAGTLSSTRGI